MLAAPEEGARQQRGASSKAKSRSGAGVGKLPGLLGLRGPPPARPHSLTRVSAAAGRAAGRRAASPSRVVLGVGRRSLSPPFPGAAGPGPMCPFLRCGLGASWGGGLWAMTLNNSCSFLEVGLSGGERRAGRPAATADRRVARVVGWRLVRAVAGGRSCPSGPASPKPVAPFRRRPAPSRAPARSEQSQ